MTKSIKTKKLASLILAVVLVFALAAPAMADWTLRPDHVGSLSNNYLNINRSSTSDSMKGKTLILYRTSAPGFDQNFTVVYTTYQGRNCMYLQRQENGIVYAINRSGSSYSYGHKAIMWTISDGKQDSAFKRPYSDSNGLVNLLNYNEGLSYTSDAPGALVYFQFGMSASWFADGSPAL